MLDVTGLVVGSTFLVATGAFVWVLWSSYLRHRETMKRIEMGGNADTASGQARVRTAE
jgi:hypothetical protein